MKTLTSLHGRGIWFQDDTYWRKVSRYDLWSKMLVYPSTPGEEVKISLTLLIQLCEPNCAPLVPILCSEKGKFI